MYPPPGCNSYSTAAARSTATPTSGISSIGAKSTRPCLASKASPASCPASVTSPSSPPTHTASNAVSSYATCDAYLSSPRLSSPSTDSGKTATLRHTFRQPSQDLCQRRRGQEHLQVPLQASSRPTVPVECARREAHRRRPLNHARRERRVSLDSVSPAGPLLRRETF